MKALFPIWLLVLCGCAPVPTEDPRLCVESLSIQPKLDCLAAPPLTEGVAILVTHLLPAGIDPYGHKVELTMRAAGIDERQSVEYVEKVEADGGTNFLEAIAIFEFPADAGCLVLISANVLNAHQQVSATVSGCQ